MRESSFIIPLTTVQTLLALSFFFLRISKGSHQNSADTAKGQTELLTLKLSKVITFGSLRMGDFME